MSKMRAVQVSKAGGPFEMVEREIPEPGPRQVRVKVQACGICHSDSLRRTLARHRLSSGARTRDRRREQQSAFPRRDYNGQLESLPIAVG